MSEQIPSKLKMLEESQKQYELTLVKLSEPLLAPARKYHHEERPNTPHLRASDASATADQRSDCPTPTPVSLAADLTHYRDLFTKLRFSYTEQVTKEKFLRYLVSSPPPPPEHISLAANTELEAQLAEIKDTLKQQKFAVSEQLRETEAHARALTRRHQHVVAQAHELRELPNVLESLNSEVRQMRKEQGIGGEAGDEQAELGLGLEATVNLAEEREAQLNRVSRRLEELEDQQERKVRELARLQKEVVEAERDRDRALKAAGQARRRRQNEEKSVGDDVEEKGRWLRGIETTMRSLLEVEG